MHEMPADPEEDKVGKSRLAKKVDKLEKEADKLRAKAEKKGKIAQSGASTRIDELQAEPKTKRGRRGLFTLLIAAVGAAAVAMKKKRDQELDEALWEEPRSI